MNKARKMLAGVTLALMTTMIIPIKTLATENTNLEMVKTGEDKYIIYIQDLQKTEFNYAISENQTTQENDLKYFKSTQDDDENQVAVVEKNVYDFAKSSKAYLWIKQDDPTPETTKEPMKFSIVRYAGGSVNGFGNLSIAGHNNYDGTMFGKTKNLEVGDIVKLTDLKKQTITYQIYHKFVTNPDDISVLTTSNQEVREVTLITCTNGNKKRLILKARETN